MSTGLELPLQQLTYPSIFTTVGSEFTGGLQSTRFVGYTRESQRSNSGQDSDFDVQPILEVDVNADVGDSDLAKPPMNLIFKNCSVLKLRHHMTETRQRRGRGVPICNSIGVCHECFDISSNGIWHPEI